MRTRLDEIIEEALGKDAILDIHAYAAAKLIARGAFAHGVEQTEPHILQIARYGGAPGTRVEWAGAPPQPAPAAEKKYTPDPCTDPLCFRRAAAVWMGRSPEHDKGDWCCRPVVEQACTNCGHTPHGTDQCKRCASRSILPYCIDRRVGQRRRPDPPPRRGTVSEYKATGISTNDVYTYNTTGSQTFWGTDRRSGRDRRKQ